MSSKNRMLKVLHFIFLCFVSFFAVAQDPGIIINEFSNGSSGTKEYIEFLVVGCPGERVNIAGWKFDDNNGDFSGGSIGGKGIAGGHSRFSTHTQWTSVPVGSLILVYNSADKSASITLPDDPSDANNDSVYVLSHNHSAFIQTCNSAPDVGNGTYSCGTFGAGSWTSVGMRNDGDAAQVRKPDGTYFHGFGYGDNNGGPDNLYFPGSGTGKVYSYTSSSCNYKNISNFTAQSVAGNETPGRANNASNLNYIRFLKEHITSGVISSNQTICSGQQPAAITESGTLIRCYIDYQWESSTTNTAGSFHIISGALSATYTPPPLTVTTYFRRVVYNNCENAISNVITITVNPAIAKADKPTVAVTDLCINPANSTLSTNAVTNATGYTWELFPAAAGLISGSTTSATVDWNNTYTGTAKVVVKAQGCGGNVPSDTTVFTIVSSMTPPTAGPDQTGICGNTAILAATGAGTWSVSSGAGGSFSGTTLRNAVFTGSPGVTYDLQWNYPASSCTSAGSDNVTIAFAAIPAAPVTKDTTTCVAGTFPLVASGGTNGQYRWYDLNQNPIAAEVNDTYTTPNITSSTTYYVSLNNGTCEGAKTAVHVTINTGIVPAGTVSGPAQTCDVYSALLTFTGTTGSIQWQDSTQGGVWTSIPAATANTITYNNPSAPVGVDYVRVTVTDPLGNCPVKYSNVFIVISDTCVTPVKVPIRIPNAMTPNNDGNNDVFYIENISYYPNNHLSIFNRWGNKVYETDGYNNDWDGKDLPDATYYYLLELGQNVYGVTADQNKYQGNVTILK